jgi:hypothetical protein
MNIARSIIARFGGVPTLARTLDLPKRTVQSWCETGYIPAWRQTQVLAAGQDLDPPLTPYDFFFAPEEEADAALEGRPRGGLPSRSAAE